MTGKGYRQVAYTEHLPRRASTWRPLLPEDSICAASGAALLESPGPAAVAAIEFIGTPFSRSGCELS